MGSVCLMFSILESVSLVYIKVFRSFNWRLEKIAKCEKTCKDLFRSELFEWNIAISSANANVFTIVENGEEGFKSMTFPIGISELDKVLVERVEPLNLIPSMLESIFLSRMSIERMKSSGEKGRP